MLPSGLTPEPPSEAYLEGMKTITFRLSGSGSSTSEAYLEGMKTHELTGGGKKTTRSSEAYLEGMKTCCFAHAKTASSACPKPTSKE